MNKIFGMLLLICCSATSLMAQGNYSYYRGEQVPLNLNTEYAFLVLEGLRNTAQLASLVPDAEIIDFSPYDPGRTLDPVSGASAARTGLYSAVIKFATPLNANAYQERLGSLKTIPEVATASPYFFTDDAKPMGTSNLFMVKISTLGDPAALLEMARENDVAVVGRNRFMPQWYTLATTGESAGNALEMANLFYESGRFLYSEPDFLVEKVNCVNDPLFVKQWALANTGQWGGSFHPDINACAGWANWGTGVTGTIVAVLDQGFERDHPDLAANNVGTGFDSDLGTSPSNVVGNHGTPCAGIVAAVRNNNIGVAGVAPNCGIMSISNRLDLSLPNATQSLADGLNWAWENGAAVISNSWGWKSSTGVQILEDAIQNALTNGRDGLGTVICFSAGNTNSNNIGYPAKSHPDIIVVGAMSPCGGRKSPGTCDREGSWGSDYGTDLDVMAPGVKIPTTDRQGSNGYSTGDFMVEFNGTSAACPHVAGLAGLLISENPCLGQAQVAEIIERTAQKVVSYPYATTSGRPHGLWHIEAGYGLIDIDAAMALVHELRLQNVNLTGAEVWQVRGNIFAGENVDPSQTIGPVNVNSGSEIELIATGVIQFTPGFHAHSGANFSARVISSSCNSWDPLARQIAPATAPSPAPITATSPEVADAVAFSVAPNPFSNALTFRYTLVRDSQVQATLFNFQGQEVAQLIAPTKQAPGAYETRIQLVDGLPAGMYFVRMETNGEAFIQKLIQQ